MQAEQLATERKGMDKWRLTAKTEIKGPKGQLCIDLQADHWDNTNKQGQKSTEEEDKHHIQRSKKSKEVSMATISNKPLIQHRQKKSKRNKKKQQSSFEKIDFKQKIRQQQQMIVYYDQLLNKDHQIQQIDIPYRTITLTFDRKDKDHIKNYCYQGNLIGKLNNKDKIIIFNQTLNLQQKVRFQMKAETCFQDNFVIVGIRQAEKEINIKGFEQIVSRNEGVIIGRGVRPLRGDFIGVYIDGKEKVIEFKVNQFVVHVTTIKTQIMSDKQFVPYLMVYRSGDVLRINYSLEDQFQ